MVVVSYSGKEINAKLVYYGPGLSGKTTNLEYIYQSVPSNNRGKMVSMKTRTERTLFFDFLPVDLGEMGGFKTRFLLYTVPGQVYYNATRKLVLRGVDAVIFVADSARGKMDENIESLRNLHENLKEYGLSTEDIPVVMQYNKRDLDDVYSVEELEEALNPGGLTYFEAVATTGQGVFETFRGIARVLLQKLNKDIKLGDGRGLAAKMGAGEGTAHPAPAKAPAPAAEPAAGPSMVPETPKPAAPVSFRPPKPEPAAPPRPKPWQPPAAPEPKPVKASEPAPRPPAPKPVEASAPAAASKPEPPAPRPEPEPVEARSESRPTPAPEMRRVEGTRPADVLEVPAESFSPVSEEGEKPGFWGRMFGRKAREDQGAETLVAEASLAPVEIPAVGGSGDASPVFIERRIQVPITLGPDEIVRGAKLRLVLEIRVDPAEKRNSKVA